MEILDEKIPLGAVAVHSQTSSDNLSVRTMGKFLPSLQARNGTPPSCRLKRPHIG